MWQQAKFLNRVLGTHDIPVAAYHKRRCNDAADCIRRNVLEIAHALDRLVEHALEVLGVRSNLQIAVP
jgi:hypothetical protein